MGHVSLANLDIWGVANFFYGSCSNLCIVWLYDSVLFSYFVLFIIIADSAIIEMQYWQTVDQDLSPYSKIYILDMK